MFSPKERPRWLGARPLDDNAPRCKALYGKKILEPSRASFGTSIICPWMGPKTTNIKRRCMSVILFSFSSYERKLL